MKIIVKIMNLAAEVIFDCKNWIMPGTCLLTGLASELVHGQSLIFVSRSLRRNSRGREA